MKKKLIKILIKDVAIPLLAKAVPKIVDHCLTEKPASSKKKVTKKKTTKKKTNKRR